MKKTAKVFSNRSKRIIAAMLSAAMVLSGIYLDGNRRGAEAAELPGRREISAFTDADFLSNSGTDFTDGLDYTMITPTDQVSFVLPAYPEDEEGYSYGWYLPGEEPSVDSVDPTILVAPYLPVSVINSEADKATLYRIKSGIQEVVDDPLTPEDEATAAVPAAAEKLSSIKYQLQEVTELELTVDSSPRILVTDQDPFYDPSASRTLYYADVQLACMKATETIETDPSDVIGWTDKATVEEILNYNGESYDGVYTVYKKVELKDFAGTAVYFYYSQVVRDFNISIVDASLSADSGFVSVKDHTLSIVRVTATDDIKFAVRSNDTVDTIITAVNAQDPTEIYTGEGKTLTIPGGLENAGQHKTYEITVSSIGKYPETYDIEISYLEAGGWEPTYTVLERKDNFHWTIKQPIDGTYYIGKGYGNSWPAKVEIQGKTTQEDELIIQVNQVNVTHDYLSSKHTVDTPSNTINCYFLFTPSRQLTVYQYICITNKGGQYPTDMISIVYDPQDPTIVNLSANQNGKALSIDSEGIIEGDLNPFRPVSVSFSANEDAEYDSGFGTDPVSASLSTGEPVDLVRSGDVWTVTVPANSDYFGQTLTLNVTATDKAGNATTKPVVLKYLDQVFGVSHVIDPALSDENDTNEETFNINYSITSDVELERLEIRYQREGAEEEKTVIDVADLVMIGTPETEGMYVYYYSKPIKSVDSTIYHDIGARAVNKHGVKSEEDLIEIINVDVAAPEWEDLESWEAGWYRYLSYSVKYNDAEEGDYISGVDQDSIRDISGCSIVSVMPNGDGSYTAVLSVDPSLDTDGTMVRFAIQDKAGNISDTYQKTYYIDTELPEIASFTVNGKSANNLHFGGDPKISFSAMDNIGVHQIELEISKDGEMIKRLAISNSSISNRTLSSLLDTTSEDLSDGQYTLTLKVWDRAGVQYSEDDDFASKQITFNLHNSIPYIDENLFPDEAFRNYVLQNIDTDKDMFLSEEERDAVLDIIVNDMGIKDLTGIELFTNLDNLECDDNEIKELDMGFAPKLWRLVCRNNQLTKLDVSQNLNLAKLWCAGNELTEIDVKNNTKLDEIAIQNNRLTKIDIKNNPLLWLCYVSENSLTELDVTRQTVLERLDCCDNQLAELDVSNCPKMKLLNCRDNKLTALDISYNPLMNELTCYNNQIKLLDLRNNEDIIDFDETSAMILIRSNGDLGWHTVGSDIYYVQDLGVSPKQSRLATGLNEIDGKKYYFNQAGILQKDVLPTTINVTPSTLSMTTWDTIKLEAVTTPSGAKSYLVWESDDESIVEVDPSGVLTAVKPGNTSVTVSALYDPSMMVTIPVTVKPVLSLETTELDLLSGEPVSVGYTRNTEKTKKITCESEDPEVATVTSEFEILGEGEGETDITVTVSDGNGNTEVYTIHVTVSGAESINTDVSRIELYYNGDLVTEDDELPALVDDTLEFTAKIYLEGVDEPYEYSYDNPVIQTNNGRIRLIWKTTNTDVATVTRGNVRVSDAGTTFITAQAMRTEIVSDAITISAKAPAIHLRGIKIGEVSPIEIGQSIYLKAAFTPVNAENKAVHWESEEPEVAEVNEYGRVTGVSFGKTTIRVISDENEEIMDEVEVEVIPIAVKSLTVQTGTITSTDGSIIFNSQKVITEGETLTLKHGIDHQIYICTAVNNDAANKAIGVSVYDEEGEPLTVQDISEDCTGLSDVNQVFRIDLEEVGTYDVKLVAMDGYGAKKTFTVNVAYYDEWVQDEDGSTRHYTKDKMDTGWKTIDSHRYYFGTDGIMATDWQQVDEAWYYFGTDGIMVTGWKKVSGKWYYFGTDGVMTTGWRKIGGKWYYFGGNGIMSTGWKKIGKKWYYFDLAEGFMLTGWQKLSSKWYYFDLTDGYMLAGWQKIDGKWYYFDPTNGYMLTGWQKIGNKWYFFQSGAMVTGWKQLNGKWYYFDPKEGYMITGWKKIGGTWYYFDPKEGYMVTGTVTINGKNYQFSSSGVCLNP